MREATLKTRGVQAKEELASASKHVDECRKQLDYAREQVRQNKLFLNAA